MPPARLAAADAAQAEGRRQNARSSQLPAIPDTEALPAPLGALLRSPRGLVGCRGSRAAHHHIARRSTRFLGSQGAPCRQASSCEAGEGAMPPPLAAQDAGVMQPLPPPKTLPVPLPLPPPRPPLLAALNSHSIHSPHSPLSVAFDSKNTAMAAHADRADSTTLGSKGAVGFSRREPNGSVL